MGTPLWKAYSNNCRSAPSLCPICLTSINAIGLPGGWHSAKSTRFPLSPYSGQTTCVSYAGQDNAWRRRKTIP